MSSGSTASQHSLTAFSSVVLDTLENIIAPGGRARLSPYVEAAQIQTLFGLVVDPKNRYRNIATIINQNQEKIRSLAKAWAQFCNAGKRFLTENYSETDFLAAYLIYYFSTNVAKLQVTLLDLLRAGELQNASWRVTDIGVGTGTTLVAVADFLLAWNTVCDLYQAPFPVQELQFAGLDKSATALNFASRTVQAYAASLRQCSEIPKSEFSTALSAALETAGWIIFDVEYEGNIPDIIKPNLLVASNVLNELGQSGPVQLAKILENLPEGCTALVIEPGDESRAKELMAWRRALIASGRFANKGPCTLLDGYTMPCENCWNARRQSFHQTTLYSRFRQVALEFITDQRSFDEFENNLLSWSTAWMVRGAASDRTTLTVHTNPGDLWPEDIPLQYIGRYTGKVKGLASGPVGYAPDEFRAMRDEGWKEFIKFCPGGFAGKGLTLVREPGYQIPNLRYGEQVKITHGQLAQVGPEILEIKLTSQSQIKPLGDKVQHSDSFLPGYQDSARHAVDEIAFRLFGFQNMHPFQHRILERVLTGHSILGIAATGSGKSECFILPAIVLPGLTVVVSPLVSLMMDQYDQRICERYGLNYLVTFINGEVEFIERQARLRRMELGYYKLVYLTPEQLERGYVLDSLRRANQNVGVRYLAMDEAHCISQWGHDFRPSYLNLSRRFDHYDMHPVRIALTATASPFVRQDICEELGLNPAMLEEGGDVFVESSNRPELNLVVRVKPRSADKVDNILDDLQGFLFENQADQIPGAAIVFMPHTGGHPDNPWRSQGGPKYGRLSAGVTPFAAYLERTLQQRVSIYHAKMEMDAPTIETGVQESWTPGNMAGRSRRGEQQRFIGNQTQIMVATKGFGMGIDKENIRLIIHRTPPSNLEAYAQEAGRAGRDGFPSDVILYYSPDTAQDETAFGGTNPVQSDFEIQEFFLREKYVRQCDVIAMRAFIQTIQPGVGGNLYFTNDQAIEFFSRCEHEPQVAGLEQPYTWPAFPRREPSGQESEEHAEILVRGYLYRHKTQYIYRILQALYRIRPSFEDRPRLAFLEQVQETGAMIIGGKVLNSKAILGSNAYFGNLLRAADVDAVQFTKDIEGGSLIFLSERLGLSIRETSDLLRDIKHAEGRFVDDIWRPALLDFKIIAAPKLGPATDKLNLQQWRAYAGAYRRANITNAYQRAKQNHHPDPTLDDWFSFKELNSSIGWEVTPGAAFSSQVDFKKYLSAFMALHDQREANDWASFRRLLSDYVGVNEDGSLKVNSKGSECLRAVLLGYLETYEVVAGDNCFSCSRCVSDGNFGRYSLENRLAAVVRMSPKAIEGFDRLKVMEDQFPSRLQVQTLFSVIEEDENSGRSLRGYFSGWSARLLDQNPNHKTALWVRFEGMARGVIQFQTQEFFSYARQILEKMPAEGYSDFESVLNLLSDILKGNLAYHEIQAEFYRRWQKPVQEAAALKSLLAIQSQQENRTQSQTHKAAARLVDLYNTNGPLADEAAYERFARLTARTAPTWEARLDGYRRIAPSWNWEQALQEMAELAAYPQAEELHNALCCAWVESDFSGRKEQATNWLLQRPEHALAWPKPLRSQVVLHFPESVILGSEALLSYWLLQLRDRQQACKLGLVALGGGNKLSRQALERLATDLEGVLLDTKTSLPDYLPDMQQRRQAILVLAPFIAVYNLEKIPHWLQYLIQQEKIDLEPIKPLVLQAISIAAQSRECYDAVFALQSVLVPAYLDGDVQERILEAWLPLYDNSPSLLVGLLNLLAQEQNPCSSALSDALFSAALAQDSWHMFQSLPAELPLAGWQRARRFIDRLQRFRVSVQPRLNFSQYKLSGDDLKALRDLFAWQTDPEEADMLATVLARLSERLNPYWKTPLAMLVEVLVAAGRVQAARQLSQDHPDLMIYHDGIRLTVEKFIRQTQIPTRESPIFKGYITIVERMFQFGGNHFTGKREETYRL